MCSGEIYKHWPPDGGLHPWEPHSINIALRTEGELALSWIDSERQNNNTNASRTFNHTQSNIDQTRELGDSSKHGIQLIN